MRKSLYVTLGALMLLVISGDMLFAAQGVFVRVEKATAGDISQALEYTGQVQPLQVVEIRPEVSAKITKVYFDEGAYVNAGQLLFTLDSSQYSATLASRKADLQSAETSLDSAKKYLQRLKPLINEVSQLMTWITLIEM